MTLTEKAFEKRTGLRIRFTEGWRAGDAAYGSAIEDHLPCFAHRWGVNNNVNTPELIAAYIKHASAADDNDVLVFSVTEKDGCWGVWKQYAKDHARTFKVVEGGSIHGVYMCRMYIYTKPVKERKFHPDNIGKWRAR